MPDLFNFISQFSEQKWSGGAVIMAALYIGYLVWKHNKDSAGTHEQHELTEFEKLLQARDSHIAYLNAELAKRDDALKESYKTSDALRRVIHENDEAARKREEDLYKRIREFES